MDANNKKRGRPPAKTRESQENRLISLAVDLAEKQLAEGKASAQVLTHFLRLGTVKATLELEKIKQENLLLAAKTKALESAERIEELYADAIKSMRTYQGLSEDEVEPDD